MSAHNNNRGFTLIELLIGMAIFSFGLMVVATATIALLQMYRAGTGQRSAQGSGQAGLDAIVLSARTATGFRSAANALCMRGAGQIYYLDTGTQTLMKGGWNSTSACNAAAAVNPRRVSASDTSVAQFVVTTIPTTPTNGFFSGARITLVITNRGATTILGAGGNRDCAPNQNSCALATFSTSLTARNLISNP